MDNAFAKRCHLALRSVGLCHNDDTIKVVRLTGGVASDIAAVNCNEQIVCVKFALSKLRVEEDWYAPIHRGRTEFEWLTTAGQIVPDAVPRLYGWSDSANGFVMEYINGAGIVNWKSAILSGKKDHGESSLVAQIIGRIHNRTAQPGFNRQQFDASAEFESLRIDPYLRFTASQHPVVADRILALAENLADNRVALIHGDLSPKNILIRHAQPVILDAECASMGDPAFDVAFYLNHLCIKSMHLPDSRANMCSAIVNFWNTYATQITWEDPIVMESRVIQLLSALMLARIDGKSPVEYLTEDTRLRIRTLAVQQILSPVNSVQQFLSAI